MATPKREPALCACGTKLHAKAIKLGKCKACRDAQRPATKQYVRKPNGGASVKGKPVPPKPATGSEANPPEQVRVAMSVTPSFLENAWSRLPLDLKAIAIAAALEV